MKIFKVSKKHTKEMVDWFEKRTNYHIDLVKKYCKKIVDRFPEYEKLLIQVEKHDKTKFEEPERSNYIWITWKYKCGFDGLDFDKYNPPEDMDKKSKEATEHHVLNNNHHPEMFCGRKHNLINEDNRDAKPEEIVDATKMPELSVVEMCADWMAVSEERKTDPYDWAKKNINKRWKFTKEQEDLIYKILDNIWEKI